MSKVSGACTGMVGCRPEAGCQALKRNPATLTPDETSVIGKRRPLQVARLDLQALDRGIDIAHGAADRALLAHDVPGLERLPEFELDAALGDRAEEGEAEFLLRREPGRIEGVAGMGEVGQHLAEIPRHHLR
jgi:hypothetical protein